MTVRALLDHAAESSFITERVAQLMKVNRSRVTINTSGLQGAATGRVSYSTQIRLRSPLDHDFSVTVNALILPSLTNLVPSSRVRLQRWRHLEGLSLADPDFAIPGKVDAILGADVYGAIIKGQKRFNSIHEPTALSTVFGWIIVGQLSNYEHTSEVTQIMHCATSSLSHQLQKFWELEEVSIKPSLTPSDEFCETQFRQTHSRDETGRFIVRLPISNDDSLVLGDNRRLALHLFLSTEKKLLKIDSLREKYVNFMEEYSELGHMEKADVPPRNPAFYLPHHEVFKRDGQGDKIRVVFNASSRSSTGISLNDKLLTGPKLQSELWIVISRWRMFKVAFSADIVKMFRQILVHDDDCDLQRILWRSNPTSEISEFQLKTVTYGTAPAPFLALRVLLQLAKDEENRFPLGAQALRENSYVDHIFSGADTLEKALQVKAQVEQLLAAGQFQLGKWAASDTQLIKTSSPADIRFSDIDVVSALGLVWNPASDRLGIKLSLDKPSLKPTKRNILSIVAKLFDPLGWLSPIIIVAKILIQDLWICQVGWDDPIPSAHFNEWSNFQASLPDVETISVPRWVSFLPAKLQATQIHGFCDASKRAYAACAYMRTISDSGTINVHLLVSKTKVAPVKVQTIPRLELCGAVLLSQLIKKVQTDLNLMEVSVLLWTDSEVVKAWINGHASKWPVFVAHRVAEVQSNFPPSSWNYVTSGKNPADLATRGLKPIELQSSQLWWSGPEWLGKSEDHWPRTNCTPKPKVCFITSSKQVSPAPKLEYSLFSDLILKYSSLNKVLRIIIYCLRWRLAKDQRVDYCTASEFQRALQVILKADQQQDFNQEIHSLRKDGIVPNSSALIRLHPFLDEKGILRVGGRLQNAAMSFDEKHPVILSKVSALAVLLTRDAHARTLHGGPQVTRAQLLQKYWIINGNTLVRHIVHNCVVCARYSGRPGQQLMAALPKDRVTGMYPFIISGVDYAGPLLLRTKRGRGFKSYKGYICLFVCLATKAIHLEVVTDLTSVAFLAAFKRFTGRRGMCSKLYSDNGRNFVGADRELQRLFKAASSFYQEIGELLAKEGTEWKFIPPYAPHFGGLWEAGVKSVKKHLKKVIGEQSLTFEEMSTLLCEIEACLNSRPLSPLPINPTDPAPLTPGHLLIGRPLTLVPEPGFLPESPSPSSAWRKISKMKCDFWLRWHKEYLHTLQARSKWNRPRPNLSSGQLVLLVDELSPPARWPLAQVVEAFRGDDERVMVVKVRTAKGETTRAITKVVPLPVHSAEKSEEDDNLQIF